MQQYTEYKYLYPPRPTNKVSPELLKKYDNGTYVGQIKYDGSCTLVFMDDTGFLKVRNRHNEEMTNPFLSEIDYKGMYRGSGFMVVCGELLNKNKTGEDGKPFNKKFIIWDVLVYNGIYLVGSTLQERLDLLEELYPCQRMVVSKEGVFIYTHICNTVINGVYRAPAYLNGFTTLYSQVVGVQLYEGVVLKRADAKLNYGFTEKNNFESILKCRKETRNYRF